eukprot:2623025-Pleurochrysis_carterae.AAC.1
MSNLASVLVLCPARTLGYDGRAANVSCCTKKNSQNTPHEAAESLHMTSGIATLLIGHPDRDGLLLSLELVGKALLLAAAG